jgi:pimeloyl-ACP methyl ester carboxylesterase
MKQRGEKVNMNSKTLFLESPGGRIAYEDTGGSGPLVIASPGMGDTRGAYRCLLPFLFNAGIRLVTFDLRGLGESSIVWDDYSDVAIASDYLSLLDHLGQSSAVLIGNSKTASSAVIAATDEPAKVSALILLGPFARTVPVKWWQMLLFGIMLGGPWGRAAWTAYYKKNLYPGPKPEDHNEYVAALSKNLSEPGRFKAFKEQAKDNHAESGTRLKKIIQPVLIIMGTADPDFPDARKEARELAMITRGEVMLVEESGHYPQADHPKQVASAIIDFIKRLSTGKD